MLIVPHALLLQMVAVLYFTSLDSLAYCFGFSVPSNSPPLPTPTPICIFLFFSDMDSLLESSKLEL